MSSAFEGLPKTPNLKLNKPGYDNVADIEALNENADILDAEIQGIKNTFVKSVNGKEPDAGGNVNVEKYTHPNSGVTAGTYRSVTVNAQGHVTAGSNPTLAIANGGTGATTASQACANIGALPLSGGEMTGSIYNGVNSGYFEVGTGPRLSMRKDLNKIWLFNKDITHHLSVDSDGCYADGVKIAVKNRLSTPSANSINITYGQPYTAPADGFVYFFGVASKDTGWVKLTNTIMSLSGILAPGSCFTFIPVSKGQNVMFEWDNLSSASAYFVYAQSEV